MRDAVGRAGTVGVVVSGHPPIPGSGAPAGLGAADTVGCDLLLVAGFAEGADGIGRQSAGGPPLSEVAADVGVERIHKDVVGGDDIACALRLGERFGVDEESPGGHLLHIEHRPDLTFDLVLDVVALVEHERDIGAVETASADHFVDDPEELERIGGLLKVWLTSRLDKFQEG